MRFHHSPVDKKNTESLPQVKQDSLKLRLLLSAFQMAEEGYPMRTDLSDEGRTTPDDSSDPYKDFVFTSDSYEEVSEGSPMFSVDCEMCLTTLGKNELTRIRDERQMFSLIESLLGSRKSVSEFFNTMRPQYRVTQVSDLGWIDLDLESSQGCGPLPTARAG